MSDESIIVKEPGHDLPRRPAAGEGGDRRGGQRRGPGRRRRAHAPLRRGRPPGPERPARAGARAHASSSNLNRVKPQQLALREPRRAAVRGRGTVRRDPGRHAQALRRARGHRAHRRRQRVRRVQGALRHDAGLRLRAHRGHAGRHRRQQRHPVLRVRAEGRALHRAVLPAQDPAGVPAEHHRLHGRPQVRERRHRQQRRQDGHRGRHRRGAQVHRHHRRQLRRRQLRHVRPRLLAALPVDVAERAHLGDGRRAGRQRAGHREARRHRGQGRQLERRRGSRVQAADPASSTSTRATRTTPARGCGTTA